jgi:hypothetical protein
VSARGGLGYEVVAAAAGGTEHDELHDPRWMLSERRGCGRGCVVDCGLEATALAPDQLPHLAWIVERVRAVRSVRANESTVWSREYAEAAEGERLLAVLLGIVLRGGE